MAKSLIDFITEEDYPRFNELLAIAEENKKNAPKPERKPRGPLTIEQKKALKMKAMRKPRPNSKLSWQPRMQLLPLRTNIPRV